MRWSWAGRAQTRPSVCAAESLALSGRQRGRSSRRGQPGRDAGWLQRSLVAAAGGQASTHAATGPQGLRGLVVSGPAGRTGCYPPDR